MNWHLLRERLGRGSRGSTAPFTLPTVVLEIEPDFVVGARLEGSARSPRRFRRLGVEPLETRGLEPHSGRPNISNETELRRAIGMVATLLGNGTGRIGLLVPDGTVRLGILPFETLPDDPGEAEALVRWKMRESLPFPAEEARVSFQVSRPDSGGVEVLAIAARNSVLGEYEGLLEQLNGGARLILPASVALLPLLPEGDGTGELLLHVCCGWVTAAVVVGNRLRFWRTREVGRGDPEALSQEVCREATRVLAGSRDYLKLEIKRVWVCARPPATSELTSQLARTLAQEVVPLAVSHSLAENLPPAERTLFHRFGTPLAGLVTNPR